MTLAAILNSQSLLSALRPWKVLGIVVVPPGSRYDSRIVTHDTILWNGVLSGRILANGSGTPLLTAVLRERDTPGSCR